MMDRIRKAYLDSIQSTGNVDQLRDELTTVAASLGLHNVAYLALLQAEEPFLHLQLQSRLDQTLCRARLSLLRSGNLQIAEIHNYPSAGGRILLVRTALLPFKQPTAQYHFDRAKLGVKANPQARLASKKKRDD